MAASGERPPMSEALKLLARWQAAKPRIDEILAAVTRHSIASGVAETHLDNWRSAVRDVGDLALALVSKPDWDPHAGEELRAKIGYVTETLERSLRTLLARKLLLPVRLQPQWISILRAGVSHSMP